MTLNRIKLSLLLLMLPATAYTAYFPTPLATVDDSTHFVTINQKNLISGGVFYEEGSGSGGFNNTDQKSSLGTMYSPSESFLAMLRNPQGDVQTKLAPVPRRLFTAPNFGGQRGAVDVAGHIAHRQITLASAVNLRFITFIPGFVDCALYLPFVNKQFNATSLTKRPFQDVDIIDMLLEQYMKNIGGFMQSAGNLNTEAWQGSGVGDPTVVMRWNWQQQFEDHDINALATHLYLGISVPVSKKKDEDILFSLPLGNDGHWAMPFGVGFAFSFKLPIKTGIAVDLLWQATASRLRRAKTDPDQTDLLLLNTAMISRKPGLSWRTHWFIEGTNLWRGLSVGGAYDFAMHHNDELTTTTVGFTNATINTTQLQQDWYVHACTVSAKYDLSKEFSGAPMSPIIEGFLKFPISGKRVVNANSVGLNLVIRF